MVKLLLKRISERESIVLSELILFLSTYEQKNVIFWTEKKFSIAYAF